MRIKCEQKRGSHSQIHPRNEDGVWEGEEHPILQNIHKKQCQVKVSEVDASNRCLILCRTNDKKCEEIVFIRFLLATSSSN